MIFNNGMSPVHPGQVLREVMETPDLSANVLSEVLNVPVNRITLILDGQRGISADSALRLSVFFGTTPNLWMNLQKTWELRRAEIEKSAETAKQVTPLKSVA